MKINKKENKNIDIIELIKFNNILRLLIIFWDY